MDPWLTLEILHRHLFSELLLTFLANREISEF